MDQVTLVIPCQSADGTVTGIQCADGVSSVTVQATINDNYTIDSGTASQVFVCAIAVPLLLFIVSRAVREVLRVLEH